jgi:excisionase family DNA binding protein
MQLLSIRRAARELRIAERTLREAVYTGQLPAYKLGERTLRVEKSELERWVRSRQFRPHVEMRA